MNHFAQRALPLRHRCRFVSQGLAVLAGLIVLSSFDGLAGELEQNESVSLPSSAHPQGAAIRTLRWHSGPALWHQLWIEGEDGLVVNRRLSAADLGCELGGVCTFDADLRLPPGTYTWQTRSWTALGYSPWSQAEELGVERQYLLEPNGVVSPEGVLFRWMRIPGATWYRVVVQQEDEIVVDQWLRAAETSCVEEEDVCRIAAGFELAPGEYSWKVQSWSVESKNGVEQRELTFKVDNTPL
jgi:hypothetical protein